MPELRVHNFSVSLDGYAAGPGQSREHPLGIGGDRLHEWALATRGARSQHGMPGGETGVDDDFAARGDTDVGATIMGRNMFGPVRGPWPDGEWTGWWGDDPPYHHPVFVLTHHQRPPLAMQGGTIFTFVNDIGTAYGQARAAAGDRHVRIGGGASTVRQYLRAGLVDELHLVVVPVLLHGGERLFDSVDGQPAGFECVELVCSPSVAHLRLRRAEA